MIRPLSCAALAALLAACATVPEVPAGPADMTAIATEPSARAGLYADCIAQAVANRAYGRAHDADTDLILFTCTGAPARAFYDGLAARSAEVGSELRVGDRTYRSTNAVRRDLFGVDYCFADAAGHTCVVSLNGGEFLRPPG